MEVEQISQNVPIHNIELDQVLPGPVPLNSFRFSPLLLELEQRGVEDAFAKIEPERLAGVGVRGG